MLFDQQATERHYEQVLADKPRLYHERFERHLLENRPLVARLLEKAFAETFPRPAGAMLDLGCGTAFYFPILCKHATELTGVDICAAMLRQARTTIEERGLVNCRVILGSAARLPIADHSIDVVHSWDVLHHLDDVRGVIDEIRRVLKPGGRYVAFEPNVLNPSMAWYHARRRSEWRLFFQNQFTVPRHLADAFDVRIRYDNTIISFLDERTLWAWSLGARVTSLAALRWLAFRYVLDCTLRRA